MPKISALPPMTTAEAADEAPIVDTSATTTKKWTLTLLKTYLQSLTAWITNAMVADGFSVQKFVSVYNTAATTTALIPEDDTKPQITEGGEIMTVTITPKSATNRLVIRARSFNSVSNINDTIVALFKDADANALAGSIASNANASGMTPTEVDHDMVAGTTSAITFRVRIGIGVAGTLTWGGFGGVRKLGGISTSFLEVTEYKAS